MSFMYNKLRGKIIEVFGSQSKFAAEIGLSEQSVTAKLAGRTRFSQEDIIFWSEKLKIDQNDIGVYFFAQELSNG